MNSRVAVEIMGWGKGRKFHNHAAGVSVAVDGWWADNKFIRHNHFTPTTDLNHAKMAWDKLTPTHHIAVVTEQTPEYGGRMALVQTFLDPLKLCEAMLSAVAGETP